MAVVHPQARSATIDIAGSAWPLYKLEALAAGLVTCLILVLITGSPQVAVLIAAAVGATRWIVGLAVARRSIQRTSR
ncbi:hypothetical protein NONI108955_39475 [Nocardia ninae]|uniref:Uncharacterized protein n=1 Tax=Nocardia ninae NBRC 108245 TaxID=1210091 RepID=A0A511MP93_9NOCA|nr:hypothetical protein [Nocardia ninae]GEM41766.1 hypothetical protein NN4_62850 [Nocardia ninae NBRC 108245]